MAAAEIQAVIEAQQTLDAIDYALRSIKLCGGRWYCTGIHAGQLATGCAAAAKLLDCETAAVLHAAGGHATQCRLAQAKKLAQAELKDAKAARKALGGLKQIRLALADAASCYGCGATIEKWAAYCDECVTQQIAEQGDELAAFDAFHKYADAIAAAA